MRVTAFVLAGVLATPVCVAQTKTPAPKGVKAPASQDVVGQRAGDILRELGESGDIGRARKDADALFDGVIAYAPTSGGDLGAFRTAATTHRLIAQFSRIDAADIKEFATLFRACPHLAQAMAWGVKPQDDIKKVYTLLGRLHRERPDAMDEFATLAAAVCVDFDKPVPKHTAETTRKFRALKDPNPLDVYAYFKDNEKKLAYPIRTMPVDLLVYVVDMNEPSADWAWALAKYRAERNIGRHYDEVHYDTDFLRVGQGKKWLTDGWSLPNILKCGGVCEDRAYFTAGIAKANGIPAVFCHGQSGEVGHAWVGVLEASGSRSAAWNFSYGRFGDYKDLRGTVTDPQTGKDLADSTVSLLADSMTSDSSSIQDAQALCAAAERLASLRGTVFAPEKPGVAKPLATPRQADMETCLQLLEAGLRKHPTYMPGWVVLQTLGVDDQFTLADKRKWSTILDNLCGTKHPDFSLEILTPMIGAVAEQKDRDAMWDWAAGRFAARPDLVANVRFLQGAEREKKGDSAGAWEAYQDLVKRFPNAGPFVVSALQRSEKLLNTGGKDSDVVAMYEGAWRKVEKPHEMAPEFFQQSNWFRVGVLYAKALESDGRQKEAENVLTKLGIKG